MKPFGFAQGKLWGTRLFHPAFYATAFFTTWESAYSSSFCASLLNLRMPSANFSVAIASSLCIQRNAFSLRCSRSPLLALAVAGIEFALHRALSLLQLIEQFGADGQQVRSREPNDLIHVAEARSHDLGLVTVFLVVVVNARDRGNAGILVRWDLLAAPLLLIPVVNAADEGRDQGYSGFGASNGLSEAEKQASNCNEFLPSPVRWPPESLPKCWRS